MDFTISFIITANGNHKDKETKMSTSNKGKVARRNKPFNLNAKPSNDLYSWYKSMPDHMKVKVDNPAFSHHQISLPCRIVICGTSSSGKTSLLLDMLYRMPETFSHIILCSPMGTKEPLYNYLKSKLREGDLTVCENIKQLPKLEDIDQEEGDHTLVVFDDMVVEKNQRPISDYFIRCRKKPASVCYLSQSYFGVPKIIRQQASHVWLRKMSGIRDVRLIMSDYNIDLTPQQLWNMYSDCVDDDSFLNIDISDRVARRFRKGYLEVIDPERYKDNSQSKTNAEHDQDDSDQEEKGDKGDTKQRRVATGSENTAKRHSRASGGTTLSSRRPRSSTRTTTTPESHLEDRINGEGLRFATCR